MMIKLITKLLVLIGPYNGPNDIINNCITKREEFIQSHGGNTTGVIPISQPFGKEASYD